MFDDDDPGRVRIEIGPGGETRESVVRVHHVIHDDIISRSWYVSTVRQYIRAPSDDHSATYIDVLVQNPHPRLINSSSSSTLTPL